jgi:hypothetical protein
LYPLAVCHFQGDPMSSERTAVESTQVPKPAPVPNGADLALQIARLSDSVAMLSKDVTRHIDAASLARLSVGQWLGIWIKQAIGMIIVGVLIGGCGLVASLALGGAAFLRR